MTVCFVCRSLFSIVPPLNTTSPPFTATNEPSFPDFIEFETVSSVTVAPVPFANAPSPLISAPPVNVTVLLFPFAYQLLLFQLQ